MNSHIRYIDGKPYLENKWGMVKCLDGIKSIDWKRWNRHSDWQYVNILKQYVERYLLFKDEYIHPISLNKEKPTEVSQ